MVTSQLGPCVGGVIAAIVREPVSQSQDPIHGRPSARPALGPSPLEGRRVALCETRELLQLEEIFEAQGALTTSYRLVSIVDAPDAEAVDRFLRALAGGAFDHLILMTGE